MYFMFFDILAVLVRMLRYRDAIANRWYAAQIGPPTIPLGIALSWYPLYLTCVMFEGFHGDP